MYEFLRFLSLMLQAATWLLLLGFGAWLYRRLRLRSLPWLGAYVVLFIPLGLVTPRLIGDVVNGGGLPSAWAKGEFLVMWLCWEMVQRSLTGLLLAVMVVAEVAGLLARLSPVQEGRILRLLRAVRERPVPLGLALLALTLAEPVVATILWFAMPAAKAGQLAGWLR